MRPFVSLKSICLHFMSKGTKSKSRRSGKLDNGTHQGAGRSILKFYDEKNSKPVLVLAESSPLTTLSDEFYVYVVVLNRHPQKQFGMICRLSRKLSRKASAIQQTSRQVRVQYRGPPLCSRRKYGRFIMLHVLRNMAAFCGTADTIASRGSTDYFHDM